MDAKKYFGQNFITDKNLIIKIVSTLGEFANCAVIEIGPGHGALTQELVKHFSKVVAIEIDTDLKPILQNKIKTSNFELIMGNVLELDFKSLVSHLHQEYENIVLISNTPYYITSEILFLSFANHNHLRKAVFMFQKEVALRVTAKVGDSVYNNLSIASQFYSTPKYEFTVKKNMFNPVPKVDSSIVSLDFALNYVNQVKNEIKFVAFVRKLFNNRRKTILNNLKMTRPDLNAHKMLEKAGGIDPKLRPENLTLQQYIALFNLIEQ